MENQNNKPQEKGQLKSPEVKVATTSEERISNHLLEAIETFNEFFGLCNGLEKQSLQDLNSNETCRIRCRALIKSISALKQILRIGRPTIASLEIPNRDMYLNVLKAIQDCLNSRIQQMDMAEMTPTRADDLILTRWQTDVYGYGFDCYYLSPFFWKIVAEVEEAYEDAYRVILECGLLTALTKPVEKRRKTNEIF